ncbi:hypothetical protein BS47DRAFT_1398494 [Hydnum rufescens UP504]|uniref:Uncharacterized protein n=1 Tax=Hydnum rufescens UP504 TaxID=1448309 RepID=A0A9P6AKK0_9AGAM|nr:hypothetical protein BS47DRAFT_1398494 [Hydnum rufescens UP504]
MFNSGRFRWDDSLDLYQEGTSHLFPEEWCVIVLMHLLERASLPCFPLHSLPFYERIHYKDIKLAAARAWSRWEMATSRLHLDQGSSQRVGKDDWAMLKTAYDMKKAWPEITLHFTRAGHSAREPETEKLLVEGRLASL